MNESDTPQSLLKLLEDYSSSDYYPFHMPGHKRAALEFPNPWSVDITEIEGFDNLHHASGILAGLQDEAARLFGADKSFLLVNGSTCGLLSAVSACVKRGGKLLLSRNCHKAVYHAISLRDIAPVYVMPKMTDFGIMGSLSPEAVEQALLKEPEIQAVLVVSPTYDGIVSDIGEIAKIVHRHGIPLIVDEAHGAHFPLNEQFPASALSLGADVVVQSLHKTLPAFTQTALLHLNSGRVEETEIRWFLDIYQTSSPSYLLMASIDRCMALIRQEGRQLFAEFSRQLDAFYQACQDLSHIRLFSKQGEVHCFDWDRSKILISASDLGLSGLELYRILLNRYHLQMEMASGHYVLALTSLMDRPEGFRRLAEALWQIEREYSPVDRECSALDMNTPRPESETISAVPGQMVEAAGETAHITPSRELYRIPSQAMTITAATELPGHSVLLEDCANAVSREYLYLYPPGIPLLTPGEIIDGELLSSILRIRKAGLPLEGLSDLTNTRINIVNL